MDREFQRLHTVIRMGYRVLMLLPASFCKARTYCDVITGHVLGVNVLPR